MEDCDKKSKYLIMLTLFYSWILVFMGGFMYKFDSQYINPEISKVILLSGTTMIVFIYTFKFVFKFLR